MSLAFKRMYIDIPTETHERLVIEAATRGMSQKGLVAQLIEEACEPEEKSPPRKTTRKKRRSKK